MHNMNVHYVQMRVREERPMPGFTMHSHDDDPVQIVRTIARISQMLIELRDEYLTQHREDALDQIERRVQELQDLADQLRVARSADSDTA